MKTLSQTEHSSNPLPLRSKLIRYSSYLTLILFSVGACDAATEEEEETPATLSPQLPVDPAPQFTEAGSYSCQDCPDSAMSFEAIAAGSQTTHTFSGTVNDAVGDGTFYIYSNAGGAPRAIAGTIPTAANGSFNFTVPLYCGEQLVKCVWENATGQYVFVQTAITTDCVEPDIRLTLTWDDLGRDYELHFIKEGGRINDNATDCTWTSCINASPDWGVAGDVTDNPKKDVDNTGNYGPENIFLSNPENETYSVMVEHWGAGTAESDGTLFVSAGDNNYILEVENLPSHYVWNVGTLSWPSGEFTAIEEKIDCIANWQGGCKMEIPE